LYLGEIVLFRGLADLLPAAITAKAAPPCAWCPRSRGFRDVGADSACVSWVATDGAETATTDSSAHSEVHGFGPDPMSANPANVGTQDVGLLYVSDLRLRRELATRRRRSGRKRSPVNSPKSWQRFTMASILPVP